jgi:TonB family protein
MKNATLSALVCVACLTLGAQDNATAKLPADPKAILEMAAPFYNYDAATAKPWHLSYRYRLLDDQGNASADGKFEYWWAPGKVSRVTWTKGENAHTDWHTADGKLLRAVTGNDIAGMDHRLFDAVLVSLPKAQDYDSGPMSSLMSLKLVTLNNAGSVNLCVAVVPTRSAADFHSDSLAGVGTAYCFDSQAPVLVSTVQNHTITNSYSKIEKFMGHNVAGHIDISYVGQKKVEADLVEVKEIQADDAAFTPSPDAKEPPIQIITMKQVPITKGADGSTYAGMTPGVVIERVPPVYPPIARAQRIAGTVKIMATIGKDGTVHDAKVLSSPDASLSQAALDAVAQWRYQPYTLNGAPVEVKTTINVDFSLNH